MRNKRIIVSFAVFVLLMTLLQSCGFLKASLDRSYPGDMYKRSVAKQIKRFQNEGNAFCFSSTYSYDTIVWHYSADSVEFVFFRKGRIIDKRTYQSEVLSLIERFAENRVLPNYSAVLDGDMVYMYIKNYGVEETLLIDIDDDTSFPQDSLSHFIISDYLRYVGN